MTKRYATIYAGALVSAIAWGGTSAQALTQQECSVKYKTAQTAGTLKGMKWNDFRKAECGTGAAAAPAAAPAAATKPAAQVAAPIKPAAPATASPTQAPAPAVAAPAKPAAPTRAAATPKQAPAPDAVKTGANQYVTAAEAKSRCSADTVVFVNLRDKVYHYENGKYYGQGIKTGAFMCENDAKAFKAAAAKNEKHP